jgi:hypothetical protein
MGIAWRRSTIKASKMAYKQGGRLERHITSHSIEMLLCLQRVICGGMCERHPKICKRTMR